MMSWYMIATRLPRHMGIPRARTNSNAGGPEEAALPTTARLDGEKEDSQRKSARRGGDAGGVGSFVKPSGLETLPLEELERRWRSCCSRLGLPGISSAGRSA